MTTQPMPRSVALAKLLKLGDLTHEDAATCCGWGWDGFKDAAHAARAAGLITHENRNGTRIYRAGQSTRKGGYRAWNRGAA